MTAKASLNIQDSFLNQVRKENIQTIVYLINGFQIKGTIKGFDNFTVVIESDGKQMLIYKHAISTVTPSKPVNTSFLDVENRRTPSSDKRNSSTG